MWRRTSRGRRAILAADVAARLLASGVARTRSVDPLVAMREEVTGSDGAARPVYGLDGAAHLVDRGGPRAALFRGMSRPVVNCFLRDRRSRLSVIAAIFLERKRIAGAQGAGPLLIGDVDWKRTTAAFRLPTRWLRCLDLERKTFTSDRGVFAFSVARSWQVRHSQWCTSAIRRWIVGVTVPADSAPFRECTSSCRVFRCSSLPCAWLRKGSASMPGHPNPRMSIRILRRSWRRCG